MPGIDPELIRAHLISRPTPLEPAPRLARAIGLAAEDLWIKRDDLIGLGGGGNKARKLERTAGAACARGATTLVTCGAAQSGGLPGLFGHPGAMAQASALVDAQSESFR